MAVVHLVRHTAVAAHWTGRCYGQSDVGLSREGRAAARALARQIALLGARQIYVSPLRRSRFLAALATRDVVRTQASPELVIDPRLAECHFGAWEGRSWDAIYAESGDTMMGLVTAPETFRPGGTGEATFALRDRAMAWLHEAVLIPGGPVVAVCHGGPIAAIRGTLAGAPVADWPGLVPAYGAIVTLEVLSR